MQRVVLNSKSISLLFISLLIFAGCSRTSLVYKFSDWLIINRMDAYFDLNAAQKDMLDKDIGQLMVWHRKTELPRLVNSLVELKSRCNDGLSLGDIEWITSAHREFWRRFFLQGISRFANFLVTVDEAQVRHLKAAMEKKNEFLIEQMDMTEKELLEDTLEWLYGMLEDWFGGLSSDQKKQIKSWALVDHEWVEIKLNSRRWLQKSFADLAASGKTQSEIEDALRRWVVHPETTGTPEFRKRWDKRKIRWHTTLVKIGRLLTRKQIDHALDKIQDYIDDFRGLAES